jgi:hypothetical protein
MSPIIFSLGALAVKSRRTQVRDRAGGLVLDGKAPALLDLHRSNPHLAHEDADRLVVDIHTRPHELGMDSPVAICAIRPGEFLLDTDHEGFTTNHAIRHRPIYPLVIAGRRNAEKCTHHLDLKIGPLRMDERELVAYP